MIETLRSWKRFAYFCFCDCKDIQWFVSVFFMRVENPIYYRCCFILLWKLYMNKPFNSFVLSPTVFSFTLQELWVFQEEGGWGWGGTHLIFFEIQFDYFLKNTVKNAWHYIIMYSVPYFLYLSLLIFPKTRQLQGSHRQPQTVSEGDRRKWRWRESPRSVQWYRICLQHDGMFESHLRCIVVLISFFLIFSAFVYFLCFWPGKYLKINR